MGRRESTMRHLVLFEARTRRQSQISRVEQRWGYLLISPWILGFLFFSVGPMVASLYLGFTNYEMPLPPRWIGLGNYVKAFTTDQLVPRSLLNTSFMLLGVPLGLGASLLLALLLDREIPGRAVWRTVYYLPSIVPTVATVMLFQYIFQPQYGLINSLLWKAFGIEGPGWFNSVQWVKPTFILMGLWAAGGPPMIILLAGLQNIPQELYEAAVVDGAGQWDKFANITIPMLSPTIFFNLIIGVIGTFKIFSAAYIGTAGGPAYASYFYVLHIFYNAFSYWRSGYASALAWILFMIILFFTLVQFKASEAWVYYETTTMRQPGQ